MYHIAGAHTHMHTYAHTHTHTQTHTHIHTHTHTHRYTVYLRAWWPRSMARAEYGTLFYCWAHRWFCLAANADTHLKEPYRLSKEPYIPTHPKSLYTLSLLGAQIYFFALPLSTRTWKSPIDSQRNPTYPLTQKPYTPFHCWAHKDFFALPVSSRTRKSWIDSQRNPTYSRIQSPIHSVRARCNRFFFFPTIDWFWLRGWWINKRAVYTRPTPLVRIGTGHERD